MRISVSDLDAFQYYKESEEMTLDEFLARLRRQEPPTEQMEASKALHRILETTDEGEMLHAERRGHKFYFHCPIEIELPTVRELKGEIEMQTSTGKITLVGIADGVNGAILDYKLSGYFDAERYMRSLQWRTYLWMFNAHKFLYRVFIGKKDGDMWSIWEYHELPFYRYPHMDDDVKLAVNEFASFVTAHGFRAGTPSTQLTSR